MNRASVAEARRRFAQLLREAEAGRPLTFLRRGWPVAVLVSASVYDELERRFGYLRALETSDRLGGRSGVPDALTVARAAREELETRG